MTQKEPTLSVIVALHESSRQAENALCSLSPGYQRSAGIDYEVIIVEAMSGDVLGAERAQAFIDKVRYFAVEVGPAWRARSIAKGLGEARSSLVGLLFDGAHILTPRVIAQAHAAFEAFARPVIVVPDYVLDASRLAVRGNAEAELEWFATSGWKQSPYSVFENVVYGPACCNGPLSPIIGASVLFYRRDALGARVGSDPAKDRPGGGALRLQFFTELCRLRGTDLVVLAGEAAFRQTHPEVATNAVRFQEDSVERMMIDAVLPQGRGFQPVHRKPIALGEIPAEATRLLEQSAALAEFHCAVCRNKGEPSWYEDSAP